MRKQSFFQPAEKDQRKLQPLGRMQAHQRDLRTLVVIVGVGNQRGMVEKLIQGLRSVARIRGGIDQFAQVLNARISLRRVFRLKQLDIPRAVD